MGRRSEHTRDELRHMALDAARRMVDEGGLTALTSRKIATDIGYTVGSLYSVFKNIDDLIDQINAATLEELYTRALAQVDSPQSPIDVYKDADNFASWDEFQDKVSAKLHALGNAYMDYAFQHPNLWRTVFDHRSHTGNRGYYVRPIARLFELIKQVLRLFDPHKTEREVTLAAHAMWSAVHGVIALSLDNKLGFVGEADARDVATSLVSHYIDGYRTNGKNNAA